MSQTFRLSLPLIQGAQAQKHITHNEALAILDALVQPVAISAEETAPPDGVADGDLYIVAPEASGAWAGEQDSLAFRLNGGWIFLRPGEGWSAWVLSRNGKMVFDGTSWVLPAASGADMLGINAAADAVNRLTVAAPSTLLSHEGSDHRLILNKATPTDTASLVFQNDFSGRAEMGTMGSGAFGVKVSTDGATWKNALAFDPATAVPSYPAMPCFSATSAGGWREVTAINEDLPFDVVTLNTGGHFNSATSKFTAPVAGIYAFVINGFLAGATNSRICFAVDGLTRADQMQVLLGAAPLSFTSILNLNAGQAVTCRTGNVNAMFRYFQAHTAFSGWKIA